MNDTTLIDDFGRRTVFTGEQLVDDHTDTSDGRKPQWVEVGVWRTEGGHYVVQRITCYRIIHADPDCPRAEGYELVEPTYDDTYPCRSCSPGSLPLDGYAQADRITVEAHNTPQELIKSFEVDGRYSNLARAILAELSEKDDRIDDLWNTVIVP